MAARYAAPRQLDETRASRTRVRHASAVPSPGAPAPSRFLRLRRQAYLGAFSVYFASLLVWLGLGLLPPLAEAVPPLHDALSWVAESGGPFAAAAGRILEHESSAWQGAWVGVQYLFSLLNLALGALLMLRRPHDLVPRLLALGFIGTAATFNSPSHAVFHVLGHAPFITAAHFAFH